MVRPAKVDPVIAHLESYAYKPRDDEVNAPLTDHMRDEHSPAWARWHMGQTIGDIEDQHYIEHGKLASEEELAADIENDRREESHGFLDSGERF